MISLRFVVCSHVKKYMYIYALVFLPFGPCFCKKNKKKINKYKIKIEYLFKTHKEEKINSSIQDLKLTEVLLHSVRFSRPANSIICFYYLFLFLLVYFCPCFMRLKVSQNRHLKTASGSQTKHILCACPESKFMLLK